MKVAICGTHKATLDQAPFDDDGWQIWAMGHRVNHLPRVDLVVEVHTYETIVDLGLDYVDWLKHPTCDAYLHPRISKKFPACDTYPLKEIVRFLGRDYFTSSVGYLVGLAIWMEAEEIALYGVNLTSDEEYSHQKPNTEYLLGVAEGRGIKVTIADGSAILNSHYSYGDGKPMINPMVEEYEKVLASCQEEMQTVGGQLDQLVGAEHQIKEFIKALKDNERGAK